MISSEGEETDEGRAADVETREEIRVVRGRLEGGGRWREVGRGRRGKNWIVRGGTEWKECFSADGAVETKQSR